MRQNRFSGINLLAGFAASLLLLPAFAVTNAQHRGDDRDVYKTTKRVKQPATPITTQRAVEAPKQSTEAKAPIVVAPEAEAATEVAPNDTLGIGDDPPTRPWSSAGSTGQHDEDSASIVRYNSFGVNLVNGQTGSVHMRYNITAVDGLSRCPATASVVRTRFRNSDTNGNTARVTYEIRTSNISSGGNTVLYTFDSNGRGGGTAFKSATDTPAIDFNFATNMYWIEATIFRSVAAEFADLGTIQIWEATGAACP
jgi:hypothetical protein